MNHQIRKAKDEDMIHVHKIFAHYIENTTASFYHNTPSLSTIELKFETANSKGLPYLVALATDSTLPSIASPSTSASVIGYAYASPFRGPLMSYAPSVEISVFLDPSHMHRGIGTALMTALLNALAVATHYAFEPGHEVDARQIPVRNVFAIMAHDVDGPRAQIGQELIIWYQRFGFEVVGRLKGVGFKEGRWIDTVYLQLDIEKREQREEPKS